MKKLFSLLFVALLSMTAWGTTVTFEPGNPNGSNTTATSADTMTKDGVTISTTKGAFAAAQYRFAQSSTTTVSSTVGNITKVEFTSTATYGSQYGPNYFEGTGYTAQSGSKVGTWTGNAESFSLTATAQVRCSQIVVTIADTPAEELVAPVFHPAGGEITQSTEVTLTCATENASIFYWEGTEEEQGEWIYYNAPFYVNETKTYTAVATKGNDMSDYVTVTFTKVKPTCATPTFNPASGATFPEGEMLSVEISTETEGAEIWYTVNGVDFVGDAPVTVPVDETTTITAFASKEGYNDSPEATATYTMLLPYTVGGTATFDGKTDVIEGGSTAGWHTITKDNVTMKFYGTLSNYTDTVNNKTYNEYRIYKNYNVEFTTAAGNIRKIEFTCDEVNSASTHGIGGFGNEPGLTVSEDGYTGVWEGNSRDITLTTDVHPVRASQIVVTLDDEVPPIVVADPVISPKTNTRFANSQQVTITCETQDATIYYSTDNGETYEVYNAPFTITETTTVKAYAQVEDVQSNIVDAKYTLAVTVSTIAEANDLENLTDFIFYGNVVVVYQNGSNLWVKDNTGYGLIFGNQVPKNIPVGSTLAEEWDAQYNLYRGAINEYQYPNNVEVTDDEPVEIVPTEYTAAQITTDVINERVIVKNLTLTDGEGKYMYYIYNENDTLVIYNNFSGVSKPEDLTKNYDVEGMVSYYDGKVQIVPIAFTESVVAGLQGDVNNDGVVNITDVTVLISAVMAENYENINTTNADMNGDGNINITDVTMLINAVMAM